MNSSTTYTRLSASEYEEISRGLARKQTISQIARRITRSPSTVSRDISRLRYTPRSYRATFAHEIACKRRDRRGKAPPKLLANERLRAYVEKHLRLHWSPQQIAARLKLAYPTAMTIRASHETIYTYVYCLAWGELKKELVSALQQQQATGKVTSSWAKATTQPSARWWNARAEPLS